MTTMESFEGLGRGREQGQERVWQQEEAEQL